MEITKQTSKDIRDMGNLSLSWIVIIVSGLIGWLVGKNSIDAIGYFVSAMVGVFISLLIWGNPKDQ